MWDGGEGEVKGEWIEVWGGSVRVRWRLMEGYGRKIEKSLLAVLWQFHHHCPSPHSQDTRTIKGLVVSNALADIAVTDACCL